MYNYAETTKTRYKIKRSAISFRLTPHVCMTRVDHLEYSNGPNVYMA